MGLGIWVTKDTLSGKGQIKGELFGQAVGAVVAVLTYGLVCTALGLWRPETEPKSQCFFYNRVPSSATMKESCCVCLDDLVAVKLKPCDHECLCLACAARLCGAPCPLCRSCIHAVLYSVAET